MREMFTRRAVARVAAAACLCGGLLSGCGGGDDALEAATLLAAAVPAPVPAGPRSAPFDARLESDYGPGDRPGSGTAIERGSVDVGQGAESQPLDPAARTRRGLYLSRSLAERADQERGGHVVWIDAGCCASAVREGDPLDLAVMIAFATQAAMNLGPEAPFFVFGSDLRNAARLADRLVENGARHAYLVTP